ncbi:hypothetical protein [Halocatena halophila]|uniref:hypothetical protein n=1 Tax=Halocatena halophila TaxID=2814576 RepID=UPI002ED3DF38
MEGRPQGGAEKKPYVSRYSVNDDVALVGGPVGLVDVLVVEVAKHVLKFELGLRMRIWW